MRGSSYGPGLVQGTEHKLDSGNGVLKQEKQPMWPQGRRGHRKS